MRQARRILILSFVFVLLMAVGCTGRTGGGDNTTGGGIGTETKRYTMENADANNRFSRDVNQTEYETPYPYTTNNPTNNNMHTTAGTIHNQNTDIGSALTER